MTNPGKWDFYQSCVGGFDSAGRLPEDGTSQWMRLRNGNLAPVSDNGGLLQSNKLRKLQP